MAGKFLASTLVGRVGLLAFAGLAFGTVAANRSTADDVPTDEAGFTAFAAELVKKQVQGDVEVSGPLTLTVSSLQLNLDRVFEFCANNREPCKAELEDYVKRVAQIIKDKSTPITRERILLVVRTEAHVAGAEAAGAEGTRMLVRVLAPGLAMYPVVDSEAAIQTLSAEQADALGLTPDAAHDLALANTRKRISAIPPLKKGQVAVLHGDDYQPSWLAYPDIWEPVAKAVGGKLLVAAATRTDVAVIAADTPTARENLKGLAKELMENSPTPLSDTVYRWTAKGWEVAD